MRCRGARDLLGESQVALADRYPVYRKRNACTVFAHARQAGGKLHAVMATLPLPNSLLHANQIQAFTQDQGNGEAEVVTFEYDFENGSYPLSRNSSAALVLDTSNKDTVANSASSVTGVIGERCALSRTACPATTSSSQREA